MSIRIICPECGEAEDLTGSPSPEGIRVQCGVCGASWLRDSVAKKCARCGGTDLVRRPRALTQYSRGTQLSIVGIGEVMLCSSCDRRMVEWSGTSRAVPFSYKPSATNADEDNDSGDFLISP